MSNPYSEDRSEDVYVTYELGVQNEGDGFAFPGLRCVPMKGSLRNWSVGEFEVGDGQKIFGVRITYTKFPEGQPKAQPEGQSESQNTPLLRAISQEIVEIPANALNVQVHIGKLPSLYEDAFDAAV